MHVHIFMLMYTFIIIFCLFGFGAALDSLILWYIFKCLRYMPAYLQCNTIFIYAQD